MGDMRKILTKLMSDSGHTANSLATKAQVPQPTVYRFLNGETNDLRSVNVKKLAAVYGITESQLRGDEPLPGHSKDKNPISETDEFRRQLLMFYGGMSQRHRDLLVMIANQLYSIDNPRDRGAMPFPSPIQAELREHPYIPGVSEDRRKS
jgi:hypothetical protein